MKKFLFIALTLFMVNSLAAEIKFSGSAVIRPRLDMKDYGEYPSGDSLNTSATTDIYYWYRAKLNAEAQIGDGWFFKTVLGAQGPGYFTKLAAGIPPWSGYAPDNALRTGVYFMQLYFGVKKENHGYWGGIVPINGINNPALDIHFYPGMIVDIPWVLFNNNAASGFTGFLNISDNPLGLMLTFDKNNVNKTELEVGDDVEMADQYTFGVDYTLRIAGMEIQPVLLKSFAAENTAAPMTYGVNGKLPTIAGFTPRASFMMTSQSVDNTDEYTGWFFRVKAGGKMGPGSVALWYDMAEMDWDNSAVHEYSYLWVHYKVVVHQSELGEVSVKPTLRYLTHSAEGYDDFSRTRFELTTEIIFK